MPRGKKSVVQPKGINPLVAAQNAIQSNLAAVPEGIPGGSLDQFSQMYGQPLGAAPAQGSSQVNQAIANRAAIPPKHVGGAGGYTPENFISPNKAAMMQKQLASLGVTDPRIIQLLTDSPLMYSYWKETGLAPWTDLAYRQPKDPKLKGTPSMLYQLVKSGNVPELEKFLSGVAGGNLPKNMHGNIQYPSATEGIAAPVAPVMNAIANTAGAIGDTGQAALQGLGNLVSGGGGSGGAGGMGGGQAGGNISGDRIDLYSPFQQAFMNYALAQSIPALAHNFTNFAPLRAEAERKFQQETIPSLASRFTNLGGRRGSGAFARMSQQAGADLQSQLAAQEAQFNLQRQGQAANIGNMGLRQLFEPVYTPEQPSGLQQFVGEVGPTAFKEAAKVFIPWMASFLPGGPLTGKVAEVATNKALGS